jgi:flagellar biosynthesis anti-sigma factor FlgM
LGALGCMLAPLRGGKGEQKKRMRIERNARTREAERNREGGSPGSYAATGVGGDLNPDFANPDLIEPGLTEPGSADHYQDQARTSWLAAQAATPPEIRSERVATLQTAIANGTYQVSAERIAEAILSEHEARDGTAA